MLRRTLPALCLALLLCVPAGRAYAARAASVAHGASVTRAASAAPDTAQDGEVAAVDQASRRVLVLRGVEELTGYQGVDRPPVVWSWAADRASDLGDLDPEQSWTDPDEAKGRTLEGRHYLLTTASGGLVAVVDTATGASRWAADLGGDVNPHSIELLPDGNVAVAASAGGWVRLYAASQGSRATAHATFRLSGAHGVHWDERSGLLWVLGDGELTGLRVGGDPDAPALTAVRSAPLPDQGGHDLAPVLGSPGRFWVSTLNGLWQYDPAADGFTAVHLADPADPARSADPAEERDVKSIGDEPGTGRLLTVVPDHSPACDWCTSVIRLHRPERTWKLTGTQLYKARWWGGW
ncbi:DUF6528 family protein [Kitasatospora sp. NPDC059146]|uniref:DUF6528 family protein n=1 Tax=Kitasatospora sp. NPDC059146 TaxID=3346741 RepID=UPI0036BF3D6C